MRFVVVIALLLSAKSGLAKSPYLAGTLAEVFPGAGYAIEDDWKSASLASILIVPLALPYYLTTPTYTGKAIKANLYTTSRNVFGYTVFDSFQSALSTRERAEAVVPIPHFSFWDLYTAPFHLSSYKTWKIWIPLGLAATAAAANLADKGVDPRVTLGRVALALPLVLAQSFFIGTGEESEFRGFQYPAFSELTGNKWAGNVLQSLSFGICHTSWGVCTSPYVTGQIFRNTSTIDHSQEYVAPAAPSDTAPDLRYLLSTAVTGFWFGYIVGSEDLGLTRTVTAHALFDAILIMTDLLTTDNTGRVYLSFSIPLSI